MKKTYCRVCIVHITYGTHIKTKYMYMRFLRGGRRLSTASVQTYLFSSVRHGGRRVLWKFASFSGFCEQTRDKLGPELRFVYAAVVGFVCRNSILVTTLLCTRRVSSTKEGKDFTVFDKLPLRRSLASQLRSRFVSGLTMFWWLRTTVSCL